MTPKYHPEIVGRGVGYAWGYTKLQFRCSFKDSVANNLKENVCKSLDCSVIPIYRSRKFARKLKEYELTYALIVNLAEGEDATSRKNKIEYITNIFNSHRSEMDTDYLLILNL